MFRDNKLQDDCVALERFGRWQNDRSLHRAAFPLRVVLGSSPRRRLVDTVLQGKNHRASTVRQRNDGYATGDSDQTGEPTLPVPTYSSRACVICVV